MVLVGVIANHFAPRLVTARLEKYAIFLVGLLGLDPENISPHRGLNTSKSSSSFSIRRRSPVCVNAARLGKRAKAPGAGSAQSHKRSDAGPRRLSVGFGQRRGTKSNGGGGRSPVAGSGASCQYDFCYQVDRSSSLPTHLRMIVISSGVSMLWTAPQEIQMEDRSACRRVHQTDKAGPHVVLDVAARHIF